MLDHDSLAERPLAAVPVVVLDTETTGLEPGLGHRVFEIGAIRYENGRQTGEFSTLLNPDRPIDRQASKITGIFDEDVADSPRFHDIRPRLDAFLEGAIIVAHNASFDANFLGLEYALDSPSASPRKLILPNAWLCTLRLARRYFHFDRYGLLHVARHLGVPVARSHRALSDVITTAGILWRMVKHLEERFQLKTVGDLLHAQRETIVAPPPQVVDLPERLAAALAGPHDVEILYWDKNKEETRRIISPRYATNHHGAPYLTAFCHLRAQTRTFRVDRILGVEKV